MLGNILFSKQQICCDVSRELLNLIHGLCCRSSGSSSLEEFQDMLKDLFSSLYEMMRTNTDFSDAKVLNSIQGILLYLCLCYDKYC